MPLINSNPVSYAPEIPVPELPPIALTLHRNLNPDDVLYLGETDLPDGRILFVFEREGKRYGVAVRGSVQALNNEVTERELERARKRYLVAEACLETIYRPRTSGSGTCRQGEKEEATPAGEALPFLPDSDTAHEEKASERAERTLPGAGSQVESPEVVMPSRDSARSDAKVIDDAVVEPIPDYLGSLSLRDAHAGLRTPQEQMGGKQRYEKVEGIE